MYPNGALSEKTATLSSPDFLISSKVRAVALLLELESLPVELSSLGVAADGPQAATEAAMINAADAATMLLNVLLMIDAVMVSPLLQR